MSSLSSLYIKKETLQTLLKTVESKGEKGVELTVSTNNDTNQWGQNVSSWVSQTKEQREAKKNRFFTGNGKVFWTDGEIKIAEKVSQDETPQAPVDDDESLPF